MPFTPIHMGPGLLIKSLLQSSFSLIIFGWSQILMDIQPLLVMITGQGHLHGFSHTYIGATLIASFAAASGKLIYDFIQNLMDATIKQASSKIFSLNKISWIICVLSAFIGCFSHVLLDSLMHSDIQPLYPFYYHNRLLGIVSISTLHTLCVYSGIVGIMIHLTIYFVRRYRPIK